MSAIIREYAAIKYRKYRQAAVVIGLLGLAVGAIALLVFVILSPLILPGMLADAGYPGLGAAVFVGFYIVIGAVMLYRHSDLRKAYNRTQKEDLGEDD